MALQRRLFVATFVLIALLALPAGTASAEECSLDAVRMQTLVDTYNQNVDRAPAIARGQFAGERIDVRLEASDGERRFTAITAADGQIISLREEAATDPTLRVETSESTVCDVVTADSPKRAFLDAYDGGEIDVSGVGVVNSVKASVVKIGVRITRGLTGLF